ncbi:MAG: hypothetical protein LBP22_09205 [Deltaproteobacteria bacterium]|nr:hypothetical protein [Deltaproteobacteria bacterium]
MILLTADEVTSIAEFLEISEHDFIATYLVKAADYEYDYHMKSMPCSFLDGNGWCCIHGCKSAACRNFPNTSKPNRLGSMYGIIMSAEIFRLSLKLSKS